jgi:TPR repeat
MNVNQHDFWLRFGLASALTFLFSSWAFAVDQKDWDECGGADKSLALAACSRIVGSGTTSPQDRADAYLFRAGAYVAQGGFDQAIADYTEAVRLAPQNIVAYAGRAVAYFHKGDRDHAVLDYNTANRLDASGMARLAGANQEIAAIAATVLNSVPPGPSPQQASDVVAWSLIRNTTDTATLTQFVAQFPNSSLRKEAEARIKALIAAEAAKPVPPRSDEVAWTLLQNTTDEAALRRFVSQYSDSPLRKAADARIAALAAAEAAKPKPPSADEIAWPSVKNTSDQAALKQFIAQYPSSKFRKDAEARVETLAATEAAKPVPPRPDESAWALLKDTTDQAALKRFTEKYSTSPLRKDAVKRLAALAAAEAAKPIPPSPDQIAWELLKETTDRAALRHFVSQYSKSPLRKQAEARLTALEASIKDAPLDLGDPRELARALQFELKRVGCFDGVVNGEFDDATKAAWRNFAKHASITQPDDLSSDTIKAVRGIDKRICPLACPKGERADGERCVATAPPAEARPPIRGVERARPGGDTVQRKAPDGTWVTIPRAHSFADCARNMRNLGYVEAAISQYCDARGSVLNGD